MKTTTIRNNAAMILNCFVGSVRSVCDKIGIGNLLFLIGSILFLPPSILDIIWANEEEKEVVYDGDDDLSDDADDNDPIYYILMTFFATSCYLANGLLDMHAAYTETRSSKNNTNPGDIITVQSVRSKQSQQLQRQIDDTCNPGYVGVVGEADDGSGSDRDADSISSASSSSSSLSSTTLSVATQEQQRIGSSFVRTTMKTKKRIKTFVLLLNGGLFGIGAMAEFLSLYRVEFLIISTSLYLISAVLTIHSNNDCTASSSSATTRRTTEKCLTLGGDLCFLLGCMIDIVGTYMEIIVYQKDTSKSENPLFVAWIWMASAIAWFVTAILYILADLFEAYMYENSMQVGISTILSPVLDGFRHNDDDEDDDSSFSSE